MKNDFYPIRIFVVYLKDISRSSISMIHIDRSTLSCVLSMLTLDSRVLPLAALSLLAVMLLELAV